MKILRKIILEWRTPSVVEVCDVTLDSVQDEEECAQSLDLNGVGTGVDSESIQALRAVSSTDLPWRLGTAAFTLFFGGVGLLMTFADGGTRGMRGESIVVLCVSLTTVPVAIWVARTPLGNAWWKGSSTRSARRSTAMFVGYADAGISAVLMCFSNPMLSAHGAALFAILGAYVSHFTAPVTQILHSLFVASVILAFGARMLLSTHYSLVVIIAQLAVSLAVANGVVALHAHYTASVQKTLRNQLRASITDNLTGVLNRRGFYYAVDKMSYSGGQQIEVSAVIDIDRFKIVNDTLGHAAGDRVLRRVSSTLLEIAPAGSVVARTGGDEFSIYAIVDAAQFEALLNRLRAVAIQADASGSLEVFSVGISTATEPSPCDIESFSARRERLRIMLEAADQYLQFSKRTGRGRITYGEVAAINPDATPPGVNSNE